MMPDHLETGNSTTTLGEKEESVGSDSKARRRAIVKPTVLYERVSSKDQEREGYSIPAQRKLLLGYAESHGFKVMHEFTDVETAKSTGRKEFGEMVRFLQHDPGCRTILVEKTDRLYRNFHDYVALEDLNVEIHLVKEGQVISPQSKSQTKLVHGIQVVIARNFIENLKEEVKKGMREKAAQRIYPSRPPIGYRNNKAERTIETDPEKAPVVQRMFELYATGKYSLAKLGQVISDETGLRHPKSYLERILKNPFYTGLLVWDGKNYQGTHTPLVSGQLFATVQDVFRGHHKPKYRSRVFPYAGLLTCAYDDCSVTAEIKKEKYVYYHRTGYRGKCELPYFREEELGNRLGQILKNIHIPDDVLVPLIEALQNDSGRREEEKKRELERLEQRLGVVRRRLDQAYTDKLDGRISEEFWTRKTDEWQRDERQILLSTKSLKESRPRAKPGCHQDFRTGE